MKENGNRPEYVFALVGLLSALVTLALGAFWMIFLAFGTGFIFSLALFITDSLLQRQRTASEHIPLPRRVIAAIIVAISYPCGVFAFIAAGSYLETFGIGPRNVLGLIIAGVVSSLAFYSAVRMLGKPNRAALFWLLLIALVSAIVSGLAPIWGRNLLVLSPPFFISPAWFSLLIIGEMGYAWVWGRSSQDLSELRAT